MSNSGLFGSVILDVTFSMLFVYLLFSLLCSRINEFVVIFTRRRADMLKKGIRHILGDSSVLCDLVYRNQLIAALRHKEPRILEGLINGDPEYIPSRAFALALLQTRHNYKS